eukprot:scaffold689_cov375-Prasinococcus_capsulatus_cf.AAC.11
MKELRHIANAYIRCTHCTIQACASSRMALYPSRIDGQISIWPTIRAATGTASSWVRKNKFASQPGRRNCLSVTTT